VRPADACMIEGTSYAWRAYVTTSTEGHVNLARLYGPHEGVAVYAYAEVELPKGGPVLLKVGSNDGFACWFNGKKVGAFNGGRAYAPDQDILEATAVAGTNTILLKVTQMGAAWDFGVRLAKPTGEPINLADSVQ